LIIRHIEPSDFDRIINAAADWWGRPYSSDLISKWYIRHFRQTCLLAEDSGKMVGFVMGFLSQAVQDEAYIKIVMVDPAYRSKGVGRALYENFFEAAGASGRTIIRCVTTPQNKASIEFHTRLGFLIEPQEHEHDGVPVCENYDGRGGDRVVFRKVL
jgi:ribosomal protein S18 acetylase RimI-like enzyme